MTELKGDGGEGLYVRGRSGKRDMEQGTDNMWSQSQGRSSRLGCYICQSEEHLKRDCPRYNHKKSQGFVRNEDQVSGYGADGYDSTNVMMAMSVEDLLDWIMDLGGSCHIAYMRDYLVDFEEYDSGNILLGDGRECRVRDTCKVQVQMRDGSSFVLDNVRYVLKLRRNLISLGTLEKEGFTVKMQSGKIKSGLSKILRAEDTTMSTYLVNRVPSPVIRFKTPIDMLGFLVGLLVLSNGCLNRLRLSAYSWDIVKVYGFNNLEINREDSNEAAFVVAEAEKIYAHESLNFNDTVACELISKWKTRLKEEMDARSYVYVLSNGGYNFTYYFHSNGRQTSNRLSQSRIHNKKLVQTLLEGHSIMSLEDSLSGDCDVEKNGKWSYRYASESDEYQVFMDFDYAMGRSIIVMSRSITGYLLMIQAVKEAIWPRGLLEELGVELNTVAVNFIREVLEAKTVKVLEVGIEHNAVYALTKVAPGQKLQHWLELLSVGVG
ncbi:zinc finger, CCHC-type containing protein [Tanacetum coccineum]